MTDTLITPETARIAKEKGFPQDFNRLKGDNYYNFKGELNGAVTEYLKRLGEGTTGFVISAPTQSLLQKWLREEHGIHIEIRGSARASNYRVFVYDDWIYDRHGDIEDFDSYEEALEKGLQGGLKLI